MLTDAERANQPDKPDKGEFEGSCNRRACQDPGATWYNHGTRKYYCGGCAITLNSRNREWAQQEFGHDLCTEGKLNNGN